jgi:NTP pyrophosphatase (non-canonical NTP hydrolase)
MAEITLRAANEVRHIEWSNGANDGTEFYAVELFGEVGECLNVVKKLERERLGMVGSRASENDLAEELADVVICVDLLAMAYKLPPVGLLIIGGLLDTSSSLPVAISLGRAAGEVMGWVEENEDNACDFQWPRDALLDALEEVNSYAALLADRCFIDLRQAVVNKFNKTSAKYGLETRMADNASLI